MNYQDEVAKQIREMNDLIGKISSDNFGAISLGIVYPIGFAFIAAISAAMMYTEADKGSYTAFFWAAMWLFTSWQCASTLRFAARMRREKKKLLADAFRMREQLLEALK